MTNALLFVETEIKPALKLSRPALKPENIQGANTKIETKIHHHNALENETTRVKGT